MEAQPEQPAEEIKRLQRCINDLVSVLALPAIWSGGDPSQIVRTLLDVLLGMLRLDLVYVRLNDPVGEAPIEMVRVAQSRKLRARPQEIGEMLNHWLGDDPQKWPPLVRNPIGDGDISIAPLRLGLHGEVGLIVAGSQRADFPSQTERLLLSVAANQAAIGLQEARLLSEQKRVANELDQRVAQRTAELATANEGLEKEITERRLAEERLRQEETELKRSEARKAAILDSALDCIVTIDHEGCITEFNPSAERTFGYRRDEVVGKLLADLIIPPSLREQHRRGLARYLATGEARVLGRRLEMTAVRADGSEFPVELAITSIPLDGPPSFTGYLRDITERKQAIDERKRAEIQLAGEKRLLEMVASGCALSDVLAALCRFVEDTATECHCGVYLIDWSGPRLREIVAPSLPATFNDPLCELPVRCENGPCGRAAFLKTQVIAEDVESDPLWQGSPFRLLALAHGLRSCWSTPIYSLTGQVLGTFAVLQRKPASPTPLQQDLIAQVTHIASIAIERAQGEAALKRSEAFLAEAQRLSSTGSFSWRVETDQVTWSEEAYRIFELDPAVPMTPELIRTRVHPEDLPLFDEVIDRARGAGSDFEYQHRLQMSDRSVKYLQVVAHGTQDQDGRLEYIGAIQDVTERRLAEIALDKVRSELTHVTRVTSLGVLTASIAHEVNQPLSGIVTNASTCMRMLAADPPNVDGARETARRTIRDGNRASDVITRLRALFGKKDATAESVDLNEAAREVIALSLSELQRSRVILRSELADDLPPVTGDRVQLQQVILNLLRNALDAMSGVDDRPRQLVIRTERDQGDGVRLSVQDTGVGFEPQDMDRLFEAFYTTKSDGMGIGLSVSRSIVESHHGRLWAAPNDGPGATFSFSIPRGAEGVTGADSFGAIRRPAATNAEHVMRSL
jgi:PAS domain S-box-containing protein